MQTQIAHRFRTSPTIISSRRATIACMFVLTLAAVSSVASAMPQQDECPFPTFDFLQADKPAPAFHIAAGDFDGDGDVDYATLAWNHPDSVLSIYLNDGAGNLTFLYTEDIDLALADIFVAADLNNDGADDLLLAEAGMGNVIHTFISTGDATFVDGLVILPPDASGSVTPVDLDLDGDIDLVFRFQSSDGIRWLRNDGDLFFSLATITEELSVGVIVGDVNGDGAPDLATNVFHESMTILINDGTGNFPSEHFTSTDIEDVGSDKRFVDVTGNGLDDLIGIESTTSTLSVKINLGDGEFSDVVLTEIPFLYPAINLDFADLNGDGAADFIHPKGGDVDIWPSDLGGSFLSPQETATLGEGISDILPAHMNDDQMIDIIAKPSYTTTDPPAVMINLGTRIDCNKNGIADGCEIADNADLDCNGNTVPDDCDIAIGMSIDCNDNGVPDECETDCNNNGIADECEIENGSATDYNQNGLLDECEFHDCNDNGINDIVETGEGAVADCNNNNVPDGCELTEGLAWDDGEMDNAYGFSYFSEPLNVLWAVRYHAGDGVVIDSVKVPFPDYNEGLLGQPLTAFVWDDPNNDGLPYDAVVLRSGVAPIQVLTDLSGSNTYFNEIPVEPVAVTGTFFVGVVYQSQPGYSSVYPMAVDEDATFVPGTSWSAASTSTVTLNNADEFPPYYLPDNLTFMVRAGVLDCNENEMLDTCEIAKSTLPDVNDDGVADECQCIGDLSFDGQIGTADLLLLLDGWGDCQPDTLCPADLDGSDTVDNNDLIALLSAWGSCE